MGEALYSCDHTFGPEATQEQVYKQAVSPICEGVLHGYNGAIIAYGQTGSGKTHTMIGSTRNRGVGPQAVSDIFRVLSKRRCWTVEVSVLEIYNEKVRDLLAPSVTVVDIHEVCDKDARRISFHCPEATSRKVVNPEEALMALSEGMRRRETAPTDMNHHSSRSHLIFTLTIVQGDPDVGATLNGRLHIVDLAGSERLKRSMASEYDAASIPLRTPPKPGMSRSPPGSPRDQLRETKDAPKASPRGSPARDPKDHRREVGEINKSLSQLALVIHRLTGVKTGSVQLVPYRDSMLTRLLAESFGGSSKTCLIITCSPSVRDREETRCSLDFGRRAKLVENTAELNVEMKNDVAPVMEALMQKEFARLLSEKEEMQKKHESEKEEMQASMQKELARLHREKQDMIREWKSEKQEMMRQQENLVKEREDLQVQLAQARHLLAEAAASATQRHESHMSDVKRFQQDNEEMRLRLEDTFAAILYESRQREDSQLSRVLELKAEKSQLAEEWQAKLKRPNSMAEDSHPLKCNSELCAVAMESRSCSTAEASILDSSDAEPFDSP